MYHTDKRVFSKSLILQWVNTEARHELKQSDYTNLHNLCIPLIHLLICVAWAFRIYIAESMRFSRGQHKECSYLLESSRSRRHCAELEFLLLWRDTMSTVTFIKETFNWGWLRVPGFSPLLTWWKARWHAGRRGAGEGAESSISDWQAPGDDRESLSLGLSFWGLPNDTLLPTKPHLLQKGHTS